MGIDASAAFDAAKDASCIELFHFLEGQTHTEELEMLAQVLRSKSQMMMCD
jgi:hypothetical protein